MITTLPECTALCKRFRCDRQPSALRIQRKGDQKITWCTWINEECDGPWCKFGFCLDHRMTDDGYCKPSPKKARRFEKEEIIDNTVYEEERSRGIPKKYTKKFSKKIRR